MVIAFGPPERFRSMAQLRIHMMSLCIGLTITGNFKEVGLPLLVRRLNKQYEVREHTVDAGNTPGALEQGRRQVISQRIRGSDFELIDELIEIVVQFGMVTMF